MMLIENEMPVNKIGELLSENAHRLWTIFNYWISKAYSADKVSGVTRLGFDETSRKKGHEYITLGVDLEERRVLHVVEGKGKDSIKAIKTYLDEKGVDASDIQDASIDLSPAFIAGIHQHFPKAEIHFDRFHVVKLLNEAMDKVRQLERQEHEELKGHKYTFLKNQSNLSDKKRKDLASLITLFPTLGEAYRFKELFNDLWSMGNKEEADVFLNLWCDEVNASQIEPFKKFTQTVKKHQSGIINFCGTRINNGILEGINSKIQLAKRRARGFRCIKNFTNMIYFLCGKLKFDYPLYST
jgi:transposase